jgi:hypothetical protein
MELYDIAIVGYGITGMIVLAILQHKLPNVRVAIIDPHFDGGALIREYGNVISNTPFVKAINALKLIDPSYEVPSQYSNYDVNKTTPLYVLVHLLKDFIKSDVSYDRYETKVKSIKDSIITNENNSQLRSKLIILCQGSNPKSLQIDIPSIPLHIALNKDLLQRYIRSSDKVIVFGTSHSGTLVLDNLESLNISTTAIYNKEKPFYFAKDGEYDGIKEDAERIGEDIMNNKYKNITLLNIKAIDKIIKVTKKASYVIYAIGFEPRSIEIENIDATKYDSKSGKIANNIYGFGIAYPSSAPDNIDYDVGVYSFVEHILNQIENIKSNLENNN